jgi:hypothetical protein
MMSFRRAALLLIAICVAGSALYLRLRPRPVVPSYEEAVVPPAVPSAAPAAADTRPTRANVGPVIGRLFAGALVPEERAGFAVGDFDGDAAADLAVVVRPVDAAARASLAEPSPSFRLQDADAPGPPPATPRAIADGERLLAVVHGVAGASWGDGAVSRSGYLVRNAAGAQLRAVPLEKLPAAVRMRITRAHVGDVIAEQRAGRRGIVFWNGAAYVWADLSEEAAAAGFTAGGRSSPP